jgi:hypothetical protein
MSAGVGKLGFVAMLAAAVGACAPAAYPKTAAHPASSEAPVGPRVVLPAAEESSDAAAPADPGGHDHHDHHDHHDPPASPASPPAAPKHHP